MAVQKVVTYGHSALRAISKNITDFSNIRSLIDDLFDTMYAVSYTHLTLPTNA